MGTKRVGWARIRSLINENTNLMSISRPQYVKATATMTLTAAQSGQTVLVGAAAAGLATTAEISLPSATNGLYFKFVYAGNAADAQNFEISTGADANFLIGGVFQHDIGGEDGAVYHPNGSSNSTCTIVTPDSGTEIELWCDGTNWFIRGWVNSATDTGVSFDDQ